MKARIWETKTFQICDIEVAVEWKNIKNLYLKVNGKDGRVTVSAPAEMSFSQIRAFVETKENWLKKHLDSQPANRDFLRAGDFCTGEKLLLWGEVYVLELRECNGRTRIKADEVLKRIEMYCRPDMTADKKAQAWKEWCRKQMTEVIPGLIRKWEPVMQVKVREWRIRDMRTRWGTCNITKSRIWLSLQLVKKPKECLEEVVVHEMVHLLERGHNKRFYNYMDCYLPEWRKWKEVLKNPL